MKGDLKLLIFQGLHKDALCKSLPSARSILGRLVKCILSITVGTRAGQYLQE